MRIKCACYGYECKNIISIYCHNPELLIMPHLQAKENLKCKSTLFVKIMRISGKETSADSEFLHLFVLEQKSVIFHHTKGIL